ncbi:MAG: S-layer homology domain-containing protein [Peptococcaceae bacterium]|nr:S-layer homology domain-containing protein [Peptococcaceae bacterium]
MLKKLKRASAGLLVCALLCGSVVLPAQAASVNQLVHIDLWNAAADKASMGNIATDNNKQAMYNPAANTLQIAANPVNVSGYISGITAARYDKTGKGPDEGTYTDVKTLTTIQVETGTKNDGTNHTITCISSFEIELPDYITKTGVEYIPIKMSVPHTPMDVVVGTGYLDARLRIDWTQTETTALDKVVPDTTVSSGTVEDVNRTDITGIVLKSDTTELPSECVMHVTVLTSGSKYESARAALSTDDFTLYDIFFAVNSREVEPNGSLEFRFPYTGQPEIYRVNDDGSITRLRGTASSEGYSILSRQAGLFAVTGGTLMDISGVLPVGPAATETASFADTGGHWAESYILRATDAGLFSGTSATTFSPDRTMTCGMVVAVLYRMSGSPSVAVSGTLENVAAGSWYESACAWGYQNEIIGGYKTFDPEADVTREELSTMLYRYYSLTHTPVAGADLSGYTDASSISGWARDGVVWANAAKIVVGTGATTLSPSAGATRAQVATMLCRYLDYIS